METFYRLNPKRLSRYQPFLNEAAKQRVIESDTHAWRTGSYVQAAIGSAFPKGRRYPSQPFVMDRYNIDEDGEVHEITDADRFWAFAQSVNQSREIKAIEEKIAQERAEKAAQTTDGKNV